MRIAIAVLALTVLGTAQQQSTKSPVTEISADMGSCTAEFRVADMSGAGLYNVKISTVIRYGFLSKRKLELEAATNADGRARFVKLPNEAKQPIVFWVDSGVDRAMKNFDPAVECNAKYDVSLRAKK